ncbi:MAG: DDE-type integrase/transposase/recombinase [Saprospiraceae bacterium]|nr:DDE-type integrase/transposase/recombinase [Saprospiraceae bacterium]
MAGGDDHEPSRAAAVAQPAKGLVVARAGQLWVSDITYIRVGELLLPDTTTDAYSHQVVGHNFGACMDAAFCLVALQMALPSRCRPELELVHHSDRGLQYCSKLYTDLLKGNASPSA